MSGATQLATLTRSVNGMASRLSGDDLRFVTSVWRWDTFDFDGVRCVSPAGTVLTVFRDGDAYRGGVKVAFYAGRAT